MFNGRYAAGNVLLSFSILMAGASISKILLVFKNFGLSVFTARTLFLNQKNFLFPAVLNYWEGYQAALLQKIKDLKDVVWSGDGRFDSMGHRAKYGVCTMFLKANMNPQTLPPITVLIFHDLNSQETMLHCKLYLSFANHFECDFF